MTRISLPRGKALAQVLHELSKASTATSIVRKRIWLCVCVYEYRCERLVVRMCVSGQDTCGVWPYYYVYVIFVSEYIYEYVFSQGLRVVRLNGLPASVSF